VVIHFARVVAGSLAAPRQRDLDSPTASPYRETGHQSVGNRHQVILVASSLRAVTAQARMLELRYIRIRRYRRRRAVWLTDRTGIEQPWYELKKSLRAKVQIFYGPISALFHGDTYATPPAARHGSFNHCISRVWLHRIGDGPQLRHTYCCEQFRQSVAFAGTQPFHRG
jgi:hypothetical protein